LLALGNVINDLAERKEYVPYRRSKSDADFARRPSAEQSDLLLTRTAVEYQYRRKASRRWTHLVCSIQMPENVGAKL
jgi:hypothetical protein